MLKRNLYKAFLTCAGRLTVVGAVFIIIFCVQYSSASVKDSLLTLALSEKNNHKKIDLYNLLAYEYRRANKDSGHLFADQAYALSVKTNYTKGMAWYYKNKSAFLFYDNPDTALVLNRIAYDYFIKAGDTLQALSMQQHRVNIYLLKGEYSQSLSLAFAALSEYSQLPNTSHEKQTKEMELYHSLGMLYWYKSIYDSSLFYTRKEAALAHKLNNRNGIGLSLSNFSQVYGQTGENDKAIACLKENLAIGHELNDRHSIILCHSNLAYYYTEVGNAALARIHADSVLFYGNKFEVIRHNASAYRTLGLASALEGKYVEALSFYEKGMEWANKTGNDFIKADILSQSAKAYNVTGNYMAAIKNANDALQMYVSDEDLEGMEISHSTLAEAYKKSGNYQMAFEHLQQTVVLHDSVFNDTKQKTISSLQIAYETDKKEQQLKLLAKENELQTLTALRQRTQLYIAVVVALLALAGGAIIYNQYIQRKRLSIQLSQSLTDLKQTQSQLIQLEKEKEAEAIRLRISRDIHDDIGSNLTKIAMLGTIATAQAKTKMPEMTAQLESISNYARNVNHSMGEIIWAINPKQDTLENLLGYMRVHATDFLRDSGINCQLNFPEQVPAVQLNPDVKRGLFLVLKESLNNIVKHANATNIALTFSLENITHPTAERLSKTFEFLIADDGKGFNASNAKNNKEYGNNGNGLVNLEERMQQVGCSFQVQSATDSGCKVTVTGSI